MKKRFIIISKGAPYPVGTVLEEFDDGFYRCLTDRTGRIIGTDELCIPTTSIHPYSIPFGLQGQWEFHNGQARHRASPDGSAAGAIREAVYKPTPDEFDYEYIQWLEKQGNK